ncbi:MAG: hypothetical protein OXE92_04050 [Bacteroidetes bacterium]|nr:hypothetical protein [Bacteroidota bacterium]MCY4204881.1 hypothetical protein [Bacteroidota bacterium]
MNSEWSIGVGMLLGFCYTGASVIVVRIAQNTPKFIPVVLGGMVLRMFAALASLILIIQLFPVVLPAFTAAFLLVALVGIFIEITWLARQKT